MARTLRDHPEVVEAWSVTGEADAIARVRTEDNADLERLIIDLQRDGLVERTRSQVVLSRLVQSRPASPTRVGALSARLRAPRVARDERHVSANATSG